MEIKENPRKSSVQQAIIDAERLLPGVPAPDDEPDPRWQAIIEIGEYIETKPHEVWSFILKWGKHPSDDIRLAVATCLLEHLLEHHFKEYFPKVKEACNRSKRFADTFCSCSQFGHAEERDNSKAFKALQIEFRGF
jgi:hypothetical protein